MKPKKALKSIFSRTEVEATESNETVVPAFEMNQIRPTETMEVISTPPLSTGMGAPPPTEPATFDIHGLNQSFAKSFDTRQRWEQTDYVRLLRQIEVKQTEAFFLKGKLLDEIKSRFFESNKMGWVEFCESMLGLNYTTANQYIRVAKEFDVMSHQRNDLSFEHYKALLPLTPGMRREILESVKEISVKELKFQVLQRLQLTQKAPVVQSKDSAKKSENLLKEIYTMTQKLAEFSFDSSPSNLKWQLIGALEQLSTLAHQSNLLLKSNQRAETKLEPELEF
jgi:hypothetical protein